MTTREQARLGLVNLRDATERDPVGTIARLWEYLAQDNPAYSVARHAMSRAGFFYRDDRIKRTADLDRAIRSLDEAPE